MPELGEAGWGETTNKHEVPFWSDGNTLELDSDDGYITLGDSYVLTTAELYILKGWILWHINYISKVVLKITLEEENGK